MPIPSRVPKCFPERGDGCDLALWREGRRRVRKRRRRRQGIEEEEGKGEMAGRVKGGDRRGKEG